MKTEGSMEEAVDSLGHKDNIILCPPWDALVKETN